MLLNDLVIINSFALLILVTNFIYINFFRYKLKRERIFLLISHAFLFTYGILMNTKYLIKVNVVPYVILISLYVFILIYYYLSNFLRIVKEILSPINNLTLMYLLILLNSLLILIYVSK